MEGKKIASRKDFVGAWNSETCSTMMLEDFFTPAEMENGLTVPSRVEELVSVMQKEKSRVVKNVSDATRRWSAVASTIAATENRDCLDLFIQLDGLWFIGRWLKDAQGFGTGDNFVEELIISLLRALEKLYVDNDISMSSGIWITVKSLIDHKSSTIQDQAKAMFGRWIQCGANDKVTQVERVHESLEAGGSVRQESSNMDVSLSKDISTAENHAVDILHSRNPDDFYWERIKGVWIQKYKEHVSSHMKLDPPKVDAGPSVSLDPSVVWNSTEAKLATVKESPPVRQTEGAVSTETGSSPAVKQDNLEEKSELPKLNEVANDANPTCEMKIFENELVAIDISHASNNVGLRDVPPSSHAAAGECCTQISSHVEVDLLMTEPKVDMNDSSSTLVLDTSDQGGECCSSFVQDSFGSEHVLRKNEDPYSSSSQMEYIEAVDEFKKQAGGIVENSLTASNCLRQVGTTKNCGLADMELEYGLVDALEVARTVAKDVAREVVHDKDSCCSSSSKIISGADIGQPGSPDSINGKEEKAESPSGQNFPPKEVSHLTKSENLEVKPENCISGSESSQVPELAQEPEINTAKGIYGFDLNQHPTTPTVSIISASRPAVAPGLLITSAFQAASPDGDKPPTVEGGSNCSKQRQIVLNIDLNLAERSDNDTSNSVSPKQAPLSPCHFSGESSVEVIPRTPVRLNFDLNHVFGDNEGQIFCCQNGHQSQSSTSSSSSMRHTPWNIDLNDKPANESDDFYGGTKFDGRGPYLMGARLEANRKSFPQAPFPFQNGTVADPAILTNLERTGSALSLNPSMPNSHPLVYGFNGLETGPSVMFPYMDLRASSPVVPQIVSAAPAVFPSYSQTSIFMSPTDRPLGINGEGPSPSSFDLNCGYVTEGGNRDLGGLGQFFSHNESKSKMEEHVRANSQASSCIGIGKKRNEPETGWEPYLFGKKLPRSSLR